MIKFYHIWGRLFYALAPLDTIIAQVSVNNYGDIRYVGSLYTNVSYRNRGFATRLMKKVISLHGDKELQLLAQPYESVEGSVSIPLKKLVSFYRRFGFRETYPDCNYDDGVEMNRIVR
jgi:GNAT superfamily N-acetyltransferase